MSFQTKSYRDGWLHFVTPPHLAGDPPEPAYIEAQWQGRRLGRWRTEASARRAIRNAKHPREEMTPQTSKQPQRKKAQ